MPPLKFQVPAPCTPMRKSPAALVRSPDQTLLALPPEAIEKARAQLKVTSDSDAVPHLVALAVKTRRIAGDGALPALAAIGLLVLEKLGSSEEAHDLFAAAGLKDEAAAFLGSATEARAPREAARPSATVKPRRGLS